MQAAERPGRQPGHEERRIVEVGVGGQLHPRERRLRCERPPKEAERRDVLEPLRPPRELEVVHQDVEDEAERDRDQRQVVAPRLQDRHEQDGADAHRDPRRHEEGEPRGPAGREREEPDGVAAEAREGGAREVDDARGPDLEVEPLPDRDVEQRERRDERPVRARAEGQRQRQRQDGAAGQRRRTVPGEPRGERRAEGRDEPEQGRRGDEGPARRREGRGPLGQDARDDEGEDDELREPDRDHRPNACRRTTRAPRSARRGCPAASRSGTA